MQFWGPSLGKYNTRNTRLDRKITMENEKDHSSCKFEKLIVGGLQDHPSGSVIS